MTEQIKESVAEGNTQLSISTETLQNTYNNLQTLQVSDDAQVRLTEVYHMSEIQQNETIINMAKKIVWFGFGVIAIGIIFSFMGKVESALITGISGVVIEFISAIVFAFVTMSNKSKLQYFEQLSMSAESDKLMKVILTLDNKKAKENMIDKMVTNYCERRK